MLPLFDITKSYNKSLADIQFLHEVFGNCCQNKRQHILAYIKFTDETLIHLKMFKSIDIFVAKLKAKAESNVTDSTPQISTFHSKRLPQLDVYTNCLWERTVRNRDVPLDWK